VHVQMSNVTAADSGVHMLSVESLQESAAGTRRKQPNRATETPLLLSDASGHPDELLEAFAEDELRASTAAKSLARELGTAPNSRPRT
jgi:hypothetical protein